MELLRFLFATTLFSSFEAALFTQNSYRFMHEFAKVGKYNPEFVAIHKDVFSKYNKTSGAWNIMGTIKKDLGRDLAVNAQAFIFRNNEFKRAPINVDVPACYWLEQNSTLFNLDHVLEKSNLTLKCPVKAGTYYAYDVVPDASKFPPGIPRGRWMLKLTFKEKYNFLGIVEWIVTVIDK